MTALSVTFQVAAYPDGVSLQPAQFVDLLFQAPGNIITATVVGDFPAGKIGGSEPTDDQGIFYSQDLTDYTIRGWDAEAGKYRRYGVTPVGAILAYVAATAVIAGADPTLGAPKNWLWLNGGRVLIADFPDLYDIIGRQWDYTGDSALGDYTTYFRLPNMCGRIIVGAGTGAVSPGNSGNLNTRPVATYVGNDHPHNINTFAGAPPTRARFNSSTIITGVTNFMIENMPAAGAFNWMIRAR